MNAAYVYEFEDKYLPEKVTSSLYVLLVHFPLFAVTICKAEHQGLRVSLQTSAYAVRSSRVPPSADSYQVRRIYKTYTLGKFRGERRQRPRTLDAVAQST